MKTERSGEFYDPESGAELLSTTQAARFLNYHAMSILRLASRGTLRPHSRAGKSLLFLRTELEQFIDSSAWASRKAGARFLPNPPPQPHAVDKPEAVVTSPGGKRPRVFEKIAAFNWSDIPKIRAWMNKFHKKTPFRITIQMPDGSGWQMDFRASAAELDHYGELPHVKRRRSSRRRKSGATWLIG